MYWRSTSPSGWRGSSPASSTSTSPASCDRSASTSRPTPPASSPARSAGNVANNSGGPHCLAYGVTAAHVLALEVVLPDRRAGDAGRPRPGAGRPRPARRRGGVEGMLGIVTKVAVRLTPNPPAVRLLLMDFVEPADAAATVSGIIAAGVVPAAIEMMDQRITQAAEDFVHAGYPTDAGAILFVELDGLPGGVAAESAIVEDLARRPPGPHDPGGGGRGRAPAAVEGAQDRVRRGRPGEAELLPARHGRPPYPPAGGADQGLRDRRPPRAHRHERLPRRRRQPAPAARLRRPRARRARAGPRRRRGDRAGVARGRRRALRRARRRPGEAGLHGSPVQPGRPRRPGPPAGRPSTRTAWPTPARCCPRDPAAGTSWRCPPPPVRTWPTSGAWD